MVVTYPAIFYKDKDSERFVVVFPDLDNGATEGDNETDAYSMAQDFIGTWLYEYYIDKKEFPKSSDIKDLKIEEDEYSDIKSSFKSLVGIDIDDYVKKMDKSIVKKTLTIPSYLNEMGLKTGLNFSKILQDGLKRELNID